MRTAAQIALIVLAALIAGVGLIGAAGSQEYLVYIGTNTRNKSKGIYAYRFQPSSGNITPIGLVAETPYPSWIAVHPKLQYLYAANENEFKPERDKPSNISAFAMDRKTGQLTLLNRASAVGRGPCHVSVDRTGRALMLANYGSGSVAVLPIQADGQLGEATAFIQHKGSSVDPKRQAGPHAHCILPSPDNRFVLAADLGLDQVLVYRFDAAKGTLAPNEPPFGKVPPGAGARHFVFHPNSRYAYVVNEIANTVTTFRYQANKGVLTELQTVPTLPKDFSGHDLASGILIDRAGKFVYVSNRGHDSIAVFAIDPKKGTLTPVEHVPTQGKTPRSIALDPTGTYLFAANQDTHNIVLFRVDSKTGRLTPTGQVLDASPEPTAVLFVPAL
ncbi:MAG: lactonase family protein [Bryobacterales bacterium]|nr:lactonase family protein [Bryobacterales bacterium]